MPVADNARDSNRGSRSRGRSRASRSRANSRANSRRRGRSGSAATNTPTDVDNTADQEDQDDKDEMERITKRSTTLRKHNERPNLYTSLYYPDMIVEYGLGTNLNVLTGKSMHRIFKDIIYKTNHRNPERDLLQRINFEMTIRFLLLNGMSDLEELLVH